MRRFIVWAAVQIDAVDANAAQDQVKGLLASTFPDAIVHQGEALNVQDVKNTISPELKVHRSSPMIHRMGGQIGSRR